MDAAFDVAVNNFGDTRSGGLAGPAGLFIIVLMSIATVLLIRNMNKRLRRLPESFPTAREAEVARLEADLARSGGQAATAAPEEGAADVRGEGATGAVPRDGEVSAAGTQEPGDLQGTASSEGRPAAATDGSPAATDGSPATTDGRPADEAAIEVRPAGKGEA
nr:hypothetical protein [Actinoplanes sp. RD1]